MQLLDHKDLHTIAQATDSNPLPKQTSNDERREEDLQIEAAREQKSAHSAQRAGSGCLLINTGT